MDNTPAPEPRDPGTGDGHPPDPDQPIYVVVLEEDGSETLVKFDVPEGTGFEPLPDDYDLSAYGFGGKVDDDGADAQP